MIRKDLGNLVDHIINNSMQSLAADSKASDILSTLYKEFVTPHLKYASSEMWASVNKKKKKFL